MKYFLLLFIIGLSLSYLALQSSCWIIEGILLWTAFSFLLVSAAYVWIGPKLFGKGPDGQLDKLRVVLLFPYLFLNWILWNIQRLITREHCCSQIRPGLWLGRRAFLNEIPEDVTMIVDLACEFAAPRNVNKKGGYLSCPMLDGSTIDKQEFLVLIKRITSWDGSVFIHCAQGHGRSATVVAAALIAKGFANDLDDALSIIKRSRPRVHLNRNQRKMIESILLTEIYP